MRKTIALSLLILTAACQDEPDFDERYETASGEIEQTSASIEQELQAPDPVPDPAVTPDGQEPED